jgi:hypothetical protein
MWGVVMKYDDEKCLVVWSQREIRRISDVEQLYAAFKIQRESVVESRARMREMMESLNPSMRETISSLFRNSDLIRSGVRNPIDITKLLRCRISKDFVSFDEMTFRSAVNSNRWKTTL